MEDWRGLREPAAARQRHGALNSRVRSDDPVFDDPIRRMFQAKIWGWELHQGKNQVAKKRAVLADRP